MDVFGRKIPIITGIFVTGLATILMPFGGNLYPNLLILR
jgi:hypothetical protein